MFFKLLTAYILTLQNKASYDEDVSRYVQYLGVNKINIGNGFFQKLHDNFTAQSKSSIISKFTLDYRKYIFNTCKVLD